MARIGSSPVITPQPLDRSEEICGVEAEERRKIVAEQRRQLQQNGVTDQQADRGDGWLSERLYDTVPPDVYPDGMAEIARRSVQFALGEQREIVDHPAEDAWATYLGLPQRFGNVEISDDVPVEALGGCDAPEAEFYRLSNKHHGEERLINRVLRDLQAVQYRAEHGDKDAERTLETGVIKLKEYEFAIPSPVKAVDTGFTDGKAAMPPTLGTFTATLGHDEQGDFLTYDDVWDLDPSLGHISGTLFGFHFDFQPSIPFEALAGQPIVFNRKIYFNRAQAERVVALEDELGKFHDDYRYTPALLEELVRTSPERYPAETLEELRSLDPRYR